MTYRTKAGRPRRKSVPLQFLIGQVLAFKPPIMFDPKQRIKRRAANRRARASRKANR